MNREAFLTCCRQPVKVALVVGTLLSLVNQSEAISNLAFDTDIAVRILANYLIPYSVSTYSRMALMKQQVALAENNALAGIG